MHKGKKTKIGGQRGEELVVGRQAVLEVLRHGAPLKIVAVMGRQGKIIEEIAALARRRGIPLEAVPHRVFENFVCHAPGHQGVAAQVEPYPYRTVEELAELAASAPEQPFLVFLDHLQDPHNFGAILRTAHAAGVHGVVVPDRRAVPVTPAVRKAAAGAVETLPIARSSNLGRALEELKGKGYWIYGGEADGPIPYYRADFTRPLALVFGSEGKGLSLGVRSQCDQVLFIPMRRNTGSLNVSVAAALLIYAAAAQRGGWQT